MTKKSDLDKLVTNDMWMKEHISHAKRYGFTENDSNQIKYKKIKFIELTDNLIKDTEKRIARIPDDYVKDVFTERNRDNKIAIKAILKGLIILAFVAIGFILCK